MRTLTEGRGYVQAMPIALILAAVFSALCWRLNLLTAGGAAAATVVGAAAVYAGAGWVWLLLAFFVSASLLSSWRREVREQRIGSTIGKPGPRDGVQVLANGLIFSAAAVASTVGDPATWTTVAAGAIAAATADTWSTELGTLSGTPRNIVTGHRVTPGSSGGVTLIGFLGALAGALLAALVSQSMIRRPSFVPVVLAGVVGSTIDSLAGATIQERRWCDRCSVGTESYRHGCGSPTRRVGGVPGFNNDAVNLLNTVSGALVAWLLG